MIAVLFFGMTGYYSVFKLQQFTIRKEIKAQMEETGRMLSRLCGIEEPKEQA